jgi:hypothetical protein
LSKKRSDCGAFFCDNTYAAILLSQYYYDKRHKTAAAEPFGTAADIMKLFDGRFLF